MLSVKSDESLALRCWPGLLIVAAWLWLFWSMLMGHTVCAFRDSAYLYFPLFRWIDAQWAAGDLPLWNHYDQFGVPVVADGSSSVFYPGKLIFWLRMIPFSSRYGIYLASHVLLAAATCYWFARRLGCGRVGSTVAAVSYAFGGSVLFQITNAIYVVGAAWLPAALGCIWLMVLKRSYTWAILGGVCCGLMVLGGDPQLVYNVGLIGLGTIAGTCWRDFLKRKRPSLRNESGGDSNPFQFAIGNIGRMTLLVLVASVLAAIQVLPGAEWAAESERAKFTQPRNLYEWVSVVSDPKPDVRSSDSWRDIIGAPPQGTHLDHVYQFSQPPWSLGELFIPNFSGRAFPQNERWADALPGADRMWVPSLYAGCLVGILAMMGIRLWGKRRRQVWLSRWLLFFLIGSLGWYGLVWGAGELVELEASVLSDLGPQVGGLYWLMVIALPKYVMFRYPAKLFLLAALGLSLLAGLGMRRFELKRLIWPAVIGLGCGGLLLSLQWIFQTRLDQFWATVPADPLFGPFAIEEASQRLQFSLFQLMTVSGVVLSVIGIANAAGRTSSEHALAFVALVFVVDILLANAWMTAEVDSELVMSRPIGEENVDSSATPLDVLSFYRARESNDQLAEILQFQQRARMPKHHLVVPERNILSFSSIERSMGNVFAQVEGLGFVEFYEGGNPQVLNQINVHQISSNATTDITAQRNGFYQIEVTTQTDGFLAIQCLNLPDWKATVEPTGFDEKPIAIEPWLGSLMAIPVSAGKSKIELVYRPQAFYRGAWISGIGWGILVISLCISLTLRLRKRWPRNE